MQSKIRLGDKVTLTSLKSLTIMVFNHRMMLIKLQVFTTKCKFRRQKSILMKRLPLQMRE